MTERNIIGPDAEFRNKLVSLIPFLRAFARTLCGNRDFAEDIAQEALAKAWRARESFQPDTNMKAWLFTILRNEMHTYFRKSWRQEPWDAKRGELIPDAPEQQRWSSEFADVARALYSLPPEKREALILVGVAGFSYEESASIAAIEVGTVKSRVCRARRKLNAILDGEDAIPKSDRARWEQAPEGVLAQLGRLPHMDAVH
ncbi:MAG: sigma-70 family RNA polymerase sigma factor [Alphaproteobacteria bacterium]|nr:sigma-70 family RNA polymerase sigma factor [Alphaproteobacteria bacterium]